MSTSGGLKLSAVAGGPSVIRFTQRSWTGISASGIPRAAVRNMLKKNKMLIMSKHLQCHHQFSKQVGYYECPGRSFKFSELVTALDFNFCSILYD